MTSFVGQFHRAEEFMRSGDVQLKVDTLKVMLLKPGFQYSNSLVIKSQIQGFEIDQTLYYPLGGKALGTPLISTTDAGKFQLSFDTIEFTRINATIEYAVIYKEGFTLDALENPLLFHIFFGVEGGVVYNNTVFRFSWPLPVLEV